MRSRRKRGRLEAGDIQDDRHIAEEERGMLHLSGLILQSSSRGILPLRGANYVPAKLRLQVLWPQRADWQGPPIHLALLGNL